MERFSAESLGIKSIIPSIHANLGGKLVTSTAATGGAAPALCPEKQLAFWIELANAFESCSHRIRDVLREAGARRSLSDRQVMILWLCATDPQGLAQNELAGRLSLSPPQLCHLLDQLRERGLLESIRDPRDRRRQCTRLTAEGELIWKKVESDIQQRFSRFAQPAAAITPSEWIESLRQLSQVGPNETNHTQREAA